MIKVTGSKGVVDDNSLFYSIFLEAVIKHADPNATTEINKKYDSTVVIISPSDLQYKEDILRNLLYLHRLLQLKVEFSKSTQLHKKLFFTINLD